MQLAPEPTAPPGTSGHECCIHVPKPAGRTFSQRLAVAATALALCAATSNSDMILAIPFVNRDDGITADALGLFVDRLPLRLDIGQFAASSASSSNALIDYVADQVAHAVEHALPYHHITKLFSPPLPGDPGPIFSALVVYHWASDAIESSLDLSARPACKGTENSKGASSGEIKVTSTSFRPEGAMHPLTLEFSEQEGSLSCRIEYDPELIAEKHIRTLAAALPAFLSGLAEERSPFEMVRTS